jgi:hypothetical protein
MANYKNTVYNLITDKRTIPYNAAGTGTIETAGNWVIGTGTLFTTEMPRGSWLVDESQNEIRYVESVESDTKAYISQPFSIDITAGATPSIIHAKDTNVVSIALSCPSGASADPTVDGVTFPKGNTVSFSKDSREKSGKRDLVDPIILDASATVTGVLVMMQR